MRWNELLWAALGGTVLLCWACGGHSSANPASSSTATSGTARDAGGAMPMVHNRAGGTSAEAMTGASGRSGGGLGGSGGSGGGEAGKGGTNTAVSNGGTTGADADASGAPTQRGSSGADGSSPSTQTAARLPLVSVADVDLPGGATRLDYQDVDAQLGRLVVTHMNDGSVLFLSLADGSVLKEITGIPVARGVVVADDVGLVFVTSSPSSLVLIDNKSMTETTRVQTGNEPDGVGWDPVDKVVGVSDQGDGALSLIPDSGKGARKQVPLGAETGNAVFDATRGWFWITVVAVSPPDQLVAVDPVATQVKKTIGLQGCSGAHGLRLHPDGQSAFIACESNNELVRVDLASEKIVGMSPTGTIPDVMNIDPGIGWLYMAAENGDLTVFDINKSGVSLIGHDQPGNSSHTVAVDTASHRVFFPLMAGPKGTPILRIMRPTGI